MDWDAALPIVGAFVPVVVVLAGVRYLLASIRGLGR